MGTLTMTDGTEIYYKDWGASGGGRPEVGETGGGRHAEIYPGAPHGLSAVAPYKEDFHADLLSFLDG
ncbi:hypothetical protein [Streptomyces angustmyceticus]|uniref:hypothetical protein n=1 Tax=Streptomyces angustmyceticus TaxID=285578 RepID=UPI00381AB25E